ncbi:MAG: beta-propeller fold lactonase family protein, partial [Vicinamibacterales bacterium]|nr:beta-propeller fold lactonase family protein [Vicinamibacterales bacterium]
IPGVTAPGTSTPMAVSPDRRFLYVATRGEPKAVAGFAIDPTDGTLTWRSSGPLPDSMAFIVTDRTGRFLLSASFPGHVVTVSPISPPGTVRPASQVLANHPNAHSIRPDALNRRVVALTFGNDRVNQFMFDPALGILTPDEASSFALHVGTGPRHFVFHPHRPVIYVLGERDGAVHVVDVDPASGRMREKQTVSALPPGFQGTPSAADLHITPDGRALFASERTSSTLAGFRIDPSSGALSLAGHVPTEQTPRGFNIDPSGQYLLAVGQGSHHLSIYRIDAISGRLDYLKRYRMGQNPNWVEVVALP